MYNSLQLSKDLRFIAERIALRVPMGFYSIQHFKIGDYDFYHTAGYVTSRLGFVGEDPLIYTCIDKKGMLVDLRALLPNQGLGEMILNKVISLEEQIQ